MKESEEFVSSLNSKCNFEGQFLKNLRENSRQDGIPVMLRDTSQFLAMLVKSKAPKNILEIGTAVGYSGSILLKYAGVDARLTTIEVDEESIEKAKKNFNSQNFYQRVRIFQGDSTEIIPVMSGKFDFIFVDGPKSQYNTYLPYLKKMLTSNGMMVCDNVLFRDMVAGKNEIPKRMVSMINNMRDFLNVLTADEDFLTSVYNIGDGVSVSIKIKG
ncbi:MAG: O-methyltransferase [Clostridia bacterium]